MFLCSVADKIVDMLDEVTSPGSDSGRSDTRHQQPKRQPKKSGPSHKETKKLVLRVYGMSNVKIDSAIQEIESLCKDANKKKLLKSRPIQNFVSEMTKEQVNGVLLIFSSSCWHRKVQGLFIHCAVSLTLLSLYVRYCFFSCTLFTVLI